jgi:hypothetical protein
MSPVPPVSSATSRLVLRYASGKFVTFLGREKRELPRLRDSDLNICCPTGQVDRRPNPVLAQLLPDPHHARFASGRFVAILGRELPRLRDSITGGQRHIPRTRDELGK